MNNDFGIVGGGVSVLDYMVHVWHGVIMYYEMQYTEDFTTSMRFCVKDGTGEAITKEENIVIEEKWSVISRSGTWFYSWLIHILEISNHINGFALLEKKEIRIKNELLRNENARIMIWLLQFWDERLWFCVGMKWAWKKENKDEIPATGDMVHDRCLCRYASGMRKCHEI